VPMISYAQMLDWVDGRASSTIEELSWSAGTLTFTTTVANGAAGLQTLLPTRARGGTTLASLTCDGAPQPYTLQTIKGLRYAVFAASEATCRATYS
jgi:hypothetical protein